MSYLRFTHAEYRTLSALCREHDLGGRHQPAFHRLLVEALRVSSPALATRIARLGRARRTLLYWHFRERTPVCKTPPRFTAQELRVIAEACRAEPFPVRFVRPFKRILVERFQDEWPDLSRKLTCLGGQQFERLYEQLLVVGE